MSYVYFNYTVLTVQRVILQYTGSLHEQFRGEKLLFKDQTLDGLLSVFLIIQNICIF